MNIFAGVPSHNLLATIVSASDMPLLVVNASGRIDFVNYAFKQQTGLVAAVPYGAKLSRFCVPEDIAELDAFIAAPDMHPHTPNQILVHIAGAAKHVPCRVRAVHDTANAIVGFACEIDAPAQKDASKVAINEERWRVALEGTEQAIWETRQRDGEKFVTDAWFLMRGLDPFSDKTIVTKWLHMVHPDDLPDLKRYNQSIEVGEINAISCQYRYRHADGHWMWILSRGRVLSRDPQGYPDHIVGTDTDVTTLVNEQAQRNLLSSRLELSLDVSGVGIWEYDLDLETEFWDPRVCAIHGVDPDERIRPSTDWENFIHPDDKKQVVTHADHCFTKKIDFLCDYRIVRPSGEVRHVRSRAKYVHAEKGSGPRFIGVNIDITDDVRKTEELEIARAAMEHDSRHDALTGLANRRKLDEVHADFVRATKISGAATDFAIVNIDLDHFKEVNDTLGHNIGDLVLQHAAQLIEEVVSDSGLVARMGGDEFVVFLPGPFAPNQIQTLVDALLLRALEPLEFDGAHCHFGMSIGVAKNADADEDLVNVVVAADLALYQAKQDGRGRACNYETAMSSVETPHKFHTEDILHGLRANQFICHYLPQFSATTGRLVSVEALLRWNHPTLGVLDQSELFLAMETPEMVGKLTKHGLRIVLSDQAKWATLGLWVPCVSVKVAASYMRDPSFVAMLDTVAIHPDQINFEILDTRLRDVDEAVFFKSLNACRDRGIGIEIGDFGSGQSSVVGILKVAPQRIKVDDTLIAAMTEGEPERQIVEAIVEIAKISGAEVTAKGVSSAEHSALAIAIGFDILQGDCLARPVNEAKLRETLVRI